MSDHVVPHGCEDGNEFPWPGGANSTGVGCRARLPAILIRLVPCRGAGRGTVGCWIAVEGPELWMTKFEF
jgi:hypothetical protein